MKVGICGLGTVGSGLFNLFLSNREQMARKGHTGVKLAHVGCRRDHPDCDLSSTKVSRDIFDVVRDPQVDIVAELIGGTDTAKDLALEAVDAGKHLVTANKALIALHGEEVFAAARRSGVQVRYEASIAGGIPIVKAIREGLVGNRIRWIAGIINGTSNFILTEMAKEGNNRSFAETLAEAQQLGYAEADPAFDIEGTDAAHKLTILASIAFGMPLRFESVFTEGISGIAPDDMNFADELGYRIRHLGIAKKSDAGVELRVHPTLVPKDQMLARVSGVMNAVVVDSDAAGPTMYHGAGAGAGPTASAVMADIVDVFRSQGGHPPPNPGFTMIQDEPVLPMADVRSSCYLKLGVEDQAGVMARVAAVLTREAVNIEALIQKDARRGDARIVIVTNEVTESAMNRCIAELCSATDIVHSVSRIRIADLQGTSGRRAGSLTSGLSRGEVSTLNNDLGLTRNQVTRTSRPKAE